MRLATQTLLRNRRFFLFLAGVLTALSFGLSNFAHAATYYLDSSHAEVGFSVKHMMLAKVKGRFNKVEATFDYDEAKGDLSNLNVKIDAKSVDTNDKKRDDHLRNADFFDTDKHPTITFKSDKVEKKDGKPVKIMGTLTMRGVSKPLTLDVEQTGSGDDGKGGKKLGFSATGSLNRKDYGVNWNKTLDKGGFAVSEEVALIIEGEAGTTKK